MSYNKYNTRHSGRFNTPGQFVPGSEQPFQQQQFSQPPLPPPPTPPRTLVSQPQQQQQQPQQQQQQNQQQQQQQQQPQQPQQQNMDVEMKQEASDGAEGAARPPWMKNHKLAGVKKISNKERRRRQNENLRRLLTPKNALMVLNEMMPNEQVATQFKVEPANNQFYKANSTHSFCADLMLDGNVYQGFGENKLSARNAAAEKAIRDMIIKRMSKAFSAAASDGNSSAENGEGEETLPMIQLASFALHKLFSEWEYEGVKVPQMKPQGAASTSISESSEPASPAPRARPKPALKRAALPPNAAALHPAMLLTYMRPGLEYRELAVTGDRPQAMLFTMGVDVDGATYIGKASNKKEARRAAARAACTALFGVHFHDAPPATV